MRRERLIELRNAREWKQKDVAERVGITESYYGMIEVGIRTPNLFLGLKIAEIFDVSPREIFFDSTSNNMLDEGGLDKFKSGILTPKASGQ